MSNGWDLTERRTLPEPWAEFWVELYDEPPLGAYLDLQEAAVAAHVATSAAKKASEPAGPAGGEEGEE